MADLDTPLTHDELTEIATLLRNRMPAEVSPKLDPGVTTLPELDGLLTALVSGPRQVKPSEWWPEVWGAYPPEWPDQATLEAVFAVLLRHMNSIQDRLAAEDEAFEPVLGDRPEGLSEWCTGYLRGVGVAKTLWNGGGETVKVNLAPMLMFGTEKGREKTAGLPEEDLERLKGAIPGAAKVLFRFWLEDRVASGLPARREGPKVGRNDPCPCGSGKKYKKCCGE